MHWSPIIAHGLFKDKGKDSVCVTKCHKDIAFIFITSPIIEEQRRAALPGKTIKKKESTKKQRIKQAFTALSRMTLSAFSVNKTRAECHSQRWSLLPIKL